MDGVLFDSMPGHVIAYQQALEPHGIKMATEDVYAFEGMKGVEAISIVAERQFGKPITANRAKELYEEKCAIFRSLPKAEKIPGVEHLMQTMKDNGIEICVVTGSGQLSLLEKLPTQFPGLITTDRIVCSKDYAHGKPNPDPYLVGMERCKSQAEDTIVIENAPLGVKAGKAAGCFVVAVNTGPLPREAFIAAGADVIFSTMAEAEAYLFPSSNE